MSGFTQIGVGSSANDGTGDALRTAMQTVNLNFGLCVKKIASTSELSSIECVAGDVVLLFNSSENVYFLAQSGGVVDDVFVFASASVGLTWNAIRGWINNTISGQIDYPSSKEYVITLNTYAPGVISKLHIQSDAGTCSATISIDGTDVTGLSSVSVSSTKSTSIATALNTFIGNQKISLTLASVSEISEIYFTLDVL